MALSYSTGTVHKLLNDATNGGAGFAEIFKNGIIDIYSGTRPTSADNALPSNAIHLGRVTLNANTFIAGQADNGLEFGAAADRQIDKATAEVWQFKGLANGQAAWFRMKSNAADDNLASASLARLDGSISQFGGDATLQNTSIVIDNVYTLNRFRLRWPTA